MSCLDSVPRLCRSLGTHRRQRPISVSGARGGAQPGNRHGRDRDSRRGFAGARKNRAAIALGQPGRAVAHARIAAPGRRQPRRHGRAGEAQQNFQLDSPGLEAGEAAVLAAAEKYGFADRRGRARAGIGRHRAGGLDDISEAADSRAGRAHAARAGCARSRGHRLRPRNRAPDCRARSGPDRGDPRPRLRGRRSHGRHRRNHRARRAHRRWRLAGGGQSEQAEAGHAIRCTRCGPENRRSDAAVPV